MAERTLKEKTANGLIWSGLSNGEQQVLNLLFGVVLARILNSEDYEEHAQIAQQGGKAVDAARRQLESDLGHSVFFHRMRRAG